MNNIILGNLGQDRRKGNGTKVLVYILDRSLGTGISASFQDKGSRPSRKEVFMISMLGGAKRSAFSFLLRVLLYPHPEILSGPCALAGLIDHNFLRMDTVIPVRNHHSQFCSKTQKHPP